MFIAQQVSHYLRKRKDFRIVKGMIIDNFLLLIFQHFSTV